ncbi:MAG: hypothetical protein Q9227_001994 [Pyrenula ochraceoflavens]
MSTSDSSENFEKKLEVLDPSQTHEFVAPAKRIHDGPDVTFFLTSLAYRDIMTFLLQLNRAMVPRKTEEHEENSKILVWELTPRTGGDFVHFSAVVKSLQRLLEKLESLIDDAPPDTGPRRFGNVSFRKWHRLVEDCIDALLEEHIPERALHFPTLNGQDQASARDELKAYLLGSFGSPPRLDYGTGHELSFLAFLGCLWKLGAFPLADPGVEERNIVLGVFEPYLELIRHLIQIYTLEPAGSHGVWGLDDNSFLPYVFGSAQLAPAISEREQTPIEGSMPNAPDPASVAKSNLVEKERKRYMYFSAIGFIYDVKRGPFWEHSPVLYDISGIKQGWGKINKGMIKMYNAETLGKFPVVQHFPFGSMFKWEKDPHAVPPPTTTHTTSQPLRNPLAPTTGPKTPKIPGATAAPWAGAAPKTPIGMVEGVTKAPWATGRQQPPPPPPRSRFHPSLSSQSEQENGPGPKHGQLPTRAPWASKNAETKPER